jgi:hypothetical protein
MEQIPGMSNPLFRGTYVYECKWMPDLKTEQIRMNATTPLKVKIYYMTNGTDRTKDSLNVQ